MLYLNIICVSSRKHFVLALLIQKNKTKKKEKEESITTTTTIERATSLPPTNKVYKTSKKVAVPGNGVQMEVGEAEE